MRPASSPKALDLFAGVTEATAGTGDGPPEATHGNGAESLSRPSGLEPPALSSEHQNVGNMAIDAEDTQVFGSRMETDE